jgi:long-chain acyl-CoA synthetase
MPVQWRRRVAVAAAADYFFTRTLLGAAVALVLNAFPFSRTTNVRPTLEHCAWLLDHGWSVLLFPEGTRSPTGRMRPFKAGIGLLAVELGAPVVPVCINGLYHVLPRGRAVPCPGRVTVDFGVPLRFTPQTSYAEAARAVEDALRRLGRADIASTGMGSASIDPAGVSPTNASHTDISPTDVRPTDVRLKG